MGGHASMMVLQHHRASWMGMMDVLRCQHPQNELVVMAHQFGPHDECWVAAHWIFVAIDSSCREYDQDWMSFIVWVLQDGSGWHRWRSDRLSGARVCNILDEAWPCCCTGSTKTRPFHSL